MTNYKINWNKYKYSEEQLREAIASTPSARQALLKLGLNGEGAGYKPFILLIKKLQIDTSHWLGQAHLRGKTHNFTPPRPLEEILKENTPTQSHKLKLRLISANILEDKCSICGITNWHGQKLSLHLDHINGVHDDNRLENLRLLCPNCHSCTPTYAGKNIKKTIKEKCYFPRIKIRNTCIDCKCAIDYRSKRCKPCTALSIRGKTKINWPSVEELKERLKTTSYLQLGKELGITDNAIRKRIKNYSVVENSLPSQESSL